MKYYIGVDGGGTKTYYALFDENKNIVADYKTKGSNHENLSGFDEAAEIIWSGVTSLVKNYGIELSDVSFTLMGLAGIDHPFQHDALYERLSGFGLKNFELFNDGFIVVKAGSISGAAIGLNNGTGTCCNAVDSDGKMLQLAGLGDYSGDICNGHQIAKSVYQAIYDDLFLMVRKTSMTDMFFKRFNKNTRDEFLDFVSLLDSDDADPYIMPLIDFFFDGLNGGDSVCLEICDKMAQRSAELITAHTKNLNFTGDEVEVVLSGSILTKLPSEKYLEAIKEKTAALSDRKFKFIKLSVPPVMGCINWIMQDYA
ncbi:MAG: hypothetical protein K6F09_06370 [Clostridiales bacterium]|nr:hypothetical protein [Clostridiales bacterium]